MSKVNNKNTKTTSMTWGCYLGREKKVTVFRSVLRPSNILHEKHAGPNFLCNLGAMSQKILWTEGASRVVLFKKGFLKNFGNFTRNHQCWRLIKLQASRPTILYKKRLQHCCLPVKFAKFLRTPILRNICERLLLYEGLSMRH